MYASETQLLVLAYPAIDRRLDFDNYAMPQIDIHNVAVSTVEICAEHSAGRG
jgi:hypothetical protein